MKTFRLPSGAAMPAYGQGTWRMGESAAARRAEADALRLGLDLGMTLIDTAEMYGEGGAEEVVADAIAGRRDEVFLVSKVYPHNAGRKGVAAACERSLKRLRVETIDLYLLHWPGDVPIDETLAAFATLRRQGKVRDYGVSNFDVDEMEEAVAAAEGAAIATDQVLYNLSRRGIEWDLLPWCRERRLPVMAYSPIEQGRLLGHAALRAAAMCHRATPAQVALAWLLGRDGVVPIPKSSTPDRVRENRAALDLRLTAEDLADLDRAFPPPRGKTALGML